MRKVVILTGTRADFGKLKPIMSKLEASSDFELHIFATGMHLNPLYGNTIREIQKCGFKNIFPYVNHTNASTMDQILAQTVGGFSNYIGLNRPDLIVIHGDRCEALAGALVGALNNIRVAHIEGGEVSGTIDDSIRHSISKLSHVHFVANQRAEKRLLQMGEKADTIHVIGSPDTDIIVRDDLPTLEEAKERYGIPFEDYSLLIYHPVTTEIESAHDNAKQIVQAALSSEHNFIVIYPNNDAGSEFILEQYRRLNEHPRFRVFPSIRFEHFLTLLKSADYLLGNSSCGIHEAPYYGVPMVNVGSRQNNRALTNDIIDVPDNKEAILAGIKEASQLELEPISLNGKGESAKLFLDVVSNSDFWGNSTQKSFVDLSLVA